GSWPPSSTTRRWCCTGWGGPAGTATRSCRRSRCRGGGPGWGPATAPSRGGAGAGAPPRGTASAPGAGNGPGRGVIASPPATRRPPTVKEPTMAEGFATRAIHAGRLPLPAERPLATPIWQTSTFVFDDAEHYAHTLHQPREGFVYTRYENPTTAALETTLADLEGAAEAMATASGMGAIATVLLSLAGAGDHVVAQRDLYGGSYSLLAHTAPRFGIEVSFVDAGHLAAVRAALRPATRAIYAETIANPTMTVADLPALAEVGAEHDLPLVVDNAVASPYLCRPIEHGAAVVVHSATKYLGGHSDVVGGIAVFADTERHDAAWRAMIELGASPDPFAAWLVLRGVKTLALRMRAHGANARRLAELLDAHPKVTRV